jgi:hypothetical protein
LPAVVLGTAQRAVFPTTRQVFSILRLSLLVSLAPDAFVFLGARLLLRHEFTARSAPLGRAFLSIVLVCRCEGFHALNAAANLLAHLCSSAGDARYESSYQAEGQLESLDGVKRRKVEAEKNSYWSAVINGVLAPPVMVLLMLLVRKERVMGKLIVEGWLYWIGWIATAAMALSVSGMGISIMTG